MCELCVIRCARYLKLWLDHAEPFLEPPGSTGNGQETAQKGKGKDGKGKDGKGTDGKGTDGKGKDGKGKDGKGKDGKGKEGKGKGMNWRTERRCSGKPWETAKRLDNQLFTQFYTCFANCP